MKNFKGTQGTWTAKPNSAFYQVNNDCDYNNGSKSMSISVGLNLIDDEIEGLSLTEENEANAKLIAASPELLKALELIMSLSNDPEIIRIAHKAIEKAL